MLPFDKVLAVFVLNKSSDVLFQHVYNSSKAIATLKQAACGFSPHLDVDGVFVLVHKVPCSDGYRALLLRGECGPLDELILSNLSDAALHQPRLVNAALYIDLVTDIFESSLLHRPKDCIWDKQGRDFFRIVIERFISRMQPIEMVLPAFPCKSSNLEKVSGQLPDYAETLALMTLLRVFNSLKKVYPPGVILRIVSDGHVFSDLIGVDDDTVDSYNEKLRQVATELDQDSNLIFCALPDLIGQVSIDRDCIEASPIRTQTSQIASRCRAAFMHMYGISAESTRSKIHQDAGTCALYRGFSKLMQEDLASLPEFNCLASKNQRKILAFKVAFEMLRRNEAYSRLVESLFPHHVRLSIHPHPNKGPKFGINLIDPRCLSKSSQPNLLHIPTPWHNVIVKRPDGSFQLMKRREVGNATAVPSPQGVYYMMS